MLIKEEFLRRVIKKIIFENIKEKNIDNVHPKIIEACKTLLSFSGAKIIVNDTGDTLVVSYSKEVPERKLEKGEFDDSGLFDEFKNSVYFKLEEEQYSSSAPYPATPSGKRVWSVFSANSYKGLGPLLYDVGIEYISNVKNCAIMSDRKTVSSFAKPIWDFYIKRGDLEVEQMDFDVDVDDDGIVNDYDDDWVSLFWSNGDNEEGIQVNKTTPEDDSDDINMDVIFYDRKIPKNKWEEKVESWQENSLSKAFFKNNTATIDYLKDLGVIVFKNNNI